MSEGSTHGQSVQCMPFKTSTGPLRVVLLHGNLDIWVMEARNLPNMDIVHKMLRDTFGGLCVKFANKMDSSVPKKLTTDPYVSISVSSAVIGRTFVLSNTEDPTWNQHFHVHVAHYAAEVQFLVKDNDADGSQLIGAVGISAEQLLSGARIEGTYPVLGSNGKLCNKGAVLTLSIQYLPVDPLSHGCVGGVPGIYFPMRKGGTVKLYQDAHIHDGSVPVPSACLASGRYYQHGHCWRDIYEAISQAHRFIYITGWSVDHLVLLVRDDPGVENSCLGELLKVKSHEGVRVLLLVYDYPTSISILGYKTDGVMGTNEETQRFFKHSSVQLLLCPRSAAKGSWAEKQETGTTYIHHQNSVVVDADAGNCRRKVIAFVGGLDLCQGRYDTPKHQLFSALETVHKEDYHFPNYANPAAGCPREPWHDLHCQIDGPAAYDILQNFEERWLKASKRRGMQQVKTSYYDDSLLRLGMIPDIVGLAEAADSGGCDPEAWHVQVFRSIDSSSVKGFPKDPKEAPGRNLICGKNILIDMSIHTAYVKAICAAQHFIYIENEYFLGSSFNWENYKDLGADNLVPMEIALKIANKIRARERFAVYIVIPMWPGSKSNLYLKSNNSLLAVQYNANDV